VQGGGQGIPELGHILQRIGDADVPELKLVHRLANHREQGVLSVRQPDEDIAIGEVD